MERGRRSHHWDLFTRLICSTAYGKVNPKKIHPFWEEQHQKKTATEKIDNVHAWLHGNKTTAASTVKKSVQNGLE